jgi:hypothetical protein
MNFAGLERAEGAEETEFLHHRGSGVNGELFLGSMSCRWPAMNSLLDFAALQAQMDFGSL